MYRTAATDAAVAPLPSSLITGLVACSRTMQSHLSRLAHPCTAPVQYQRSRDLFVAGNSSPTGLSKSTSRNPA